MMMKYEDPKLNVVNFDVADILTASEFETPEDNFSGNGNSGN